MTDSIKSADSIASTDKRGGRHPATTMQVVCGWVADYFGVLWQIDAQRRIEMITDPNPAEAGPMHARLTINLGNNQFRRVSKLNG